MENKNKKNKIRELDQILEKKFNTNKTYQYHSFFSFINKYSKLTEYFVETSIFEKEEYVKYIQDFKKKKQNNSFTKIEKSAIGSMLGMSIGDAMGARVEFMPLDYNYKEIKDMGKGPYGNFKLNPGQWTDDTSMGLCISDSLIEKQGEFDPRDIMMRFILWWYFGYNNAFRFDNKRHNKHSVGLGGNISGSLYKYIKDYGKNEYTKFGNKKTSGNGSIMRNAAIPICYFRNKEKALDFARKQSLITHQGDEAAGCCQLMTFIIIKIFKLKKGKNLNDKKSINNNIIGEKDTKISTDSDHSNLKIAEEKNKILKIENEKVIKLKDLLDDLKDFNCVFCESVNCLAHSKIENNDVNRNWNWKDKNFKYSEERAKKKPTYIGSYCMDGLAMALHVLYHTDSFEKAILKAVNLCGDADSVGSVVGQIAGAFYEFDSIPKKWIKEINKWDNNEIALRGFILCHLNEKENEEIIKENKEKIEIIIPNIKENHENGNTKDEAKKLSEIEANLDEKKIYNKNNEEIIVNYNDQELKKVKTKNNRCRCIYLCCKDCFPNCIII